MCIRDENGQLLISPQVGERIATLEAELARVTAERDTARQAEFRMAEAWKLAIEQRDTLRAKLAEVTRERDGAHDFIRNIESALEGRLPIGYTAENATAIGAVFRIVIEHDSLRAALRQCGKAYAKVKACEAEQDAADEWRPEFAVEMMKADEALDEAFGLPIVREAMENSDAG